MTKQFNFVRLSHVWKMFCIAVVVAVLHFIQLFTCIEAKTNHVLDNSFGRNFSMVLVGGGLDNNNKVRKLVRIFSF